MDIEKRLKDDAERIAGIQPPADLRSRLCTSLDGVQARTGHVAHRWLKPAMAVLTAAMLTVALLPGRGPTPVLDLPSGDDASPEAALTEDYRGVDASGVTKNTAASQGNEEANGVVLAAPLENPPWGRVGAFSGLAMLTGALWIYEFGRRRLALALIIPLLTLLLGNLWLLRNIIF